MQNKYHQCTIHEQRNLFFIKSISNRQSYFSSKCTYKKTCCARWIQLLILYLWNTMKIHNRLNQLNWRFKCREIFCLASWSDTLGNPLKRNITKQNQSLSSMKLGHPAGCELTFGHFIQHHSFLSLYRPTVARPNLTYFGNAYNDEDRNEHSMEMNGIKVDAGTCGNEWVVERSPIENLEMNGIGGLDKWISSSTVTGSFNNATSHPGTSTSTLSHLVSKNNTVCGVSTS